jgi:RecA-family ATPase
MTRRKKRDALPDSGLLFIPKGEYDALKPPLDFIPGMLHDSTVAIIYGPPGSGKTFFALHLLCSVALGRPVFGEQPERRRGLYVGLEGEAGIKARLQAWCAQNKADSNPIDYALGRFSVANDEDVSDLIDHIREHRIQFVVIDTLTLAMAGFDEISGQHMSLVIDALHRIKRETGACVVALAHTGKNEKAGIRGHSSQLGNVDTTIEIVCHNKERVTEGNKTQVVEHDVTLATPRSAAVRKQRDGESSRRWQFGLTLKETALTDARGNVVRSPTVSECEHFTDLDAEEGEQAPPKPRKLNARQRDALAILRKLQKQMRAIGPPTLEEFKHALRREEWPGQPVADLKGAIRDVLKALESKGAIEINSNDAVELCM